MFSGSLSSPWVSPVVRAVGDGILERAPAARKAFITLARQELAEVLAQAKPDQRAKIEAALEAALVALLRDSAVHLSLFSSMYGVHIEQPVVPDPLGLG